MSDEFIRLNASFLYTTFSHTEERNKFRVVFILDSTITEYEKLQSVMGYLMEKYPQADKACKDGIRLFYGGKKVYWLDRENKLNTQHCLLESLWWDKENNSDISHPKPPNISKLILV